MGSQMTALINPIFLLLPKVIHISSSRANSCYKLCPFLTFTVASLGFSFSHSLIAYLFSSFLNVVAVFSPFLWPCRFTVLKIETLLSF